jgi:signal peptidase I
VTTTATAPTPDVSSAGPTTATGAARAWAGFLLVLLARAFRALLVTLLVISAIPLVSTWSGYVVRSGSMEPGMSVGDVIIAQPLPPDEPIPVGRVMVFDNPDRASVHTTMIHRVVENLGKGEYTTAGDANRENDSTPVATSDFTARPTLSVPFIGLPLTWWADDEIVPLLLCMTLVSLALFLSGRPPGDPRHRRRREAKAARRAAAMAGHGLQRASVVLVPVAVMIGAVQAPFAQADAAFSAATSTRATWTASTHLTTTLVLGDVPDVVRGVVPLTADLTEPTGRSFSVRIEYAVAGSTTWRTICTDATAPYACSWATTGVPSGDYDLRAVATSTSSTHTSALVEDITVDNTAPTTTMQDPGTPLRGTVTTTATASDAHSGVAKVVIQYAPSGSTTFTDVCTVTEAPFSCRFDTASVPGGSYSFRSVATDVAGNTTTSAAVTNRVIDNTVASVSMDDPGAYLSGTVGLSATANSSAGISSVRIQRAVSGTTTWTDICTDTTAPYTCSWATTAVSDGLYDLRAVMLDRNGRTTTSAPVTARRVDNSPMRAVDVQTANGGSTVGRLQSGDSMTLTYSQQASLGTISSGWTGSPQSVTVRLRDGALLGLSSTDDTVTVLRNGAAVNLGSVNLRQDYIRSMRSADFAATMTASTVTVNGVAATRITLVMGSQISGVSTNTVFTSSTMVWTPTAAATNLAGRPVSTTPVAETGVADREF